jgi:hypothetical protein
LRFGEEELGVIWVRTHCLPAGVAMVIMKGRRGRSGK